MKQLSDSLEKRSAPLELFFRNDDAGWSQNALDELLTVFAEHQMPIDLAVIPATLDGDIARRLDNWRVEHPAIGLHQHGYAHVNHEPDGERKCEFGPSRPLSRQLADIVAGRERLQSMLGDSDPIFTPPWNRCSAAAAEALSEHGFALISDDGALAKAGSTTACLPISFDWERHRREGQLETALAAQIANANGPIGIMLHHETMDVAARATLGTLLTLLNDTRGVRVHAMRHWMGDTP
jgi:peptidoglycan/xylan/chitin deacetylase (PgdA/CDA1 family)